MDYAPGSHHRQGRAQDRQPDRHPGIAGVRESDPQFNDGYQRSHQQGPQTDQKNPRADSDDFGRDGPIYFSRIVTAWVRSLAPSLERMFEAQLLTVSSVRES